MNLETIRIAFVAAVLYALKVIAADVSSAYIQAMTIEKVYTTAGPEFGSTQGRFMIIVKALYGLRSSGAMWHQHLAESLRALGFRPCEADPDLWMREMQDHYEYIAVIVDDLLIFSRCPQDIIDFLTKAEGYELKGVGIPEYFSGADIEYDESKGCWIYSAKTYVKSVCEHIEKLLNIKLKNYGSPMEAGDHPELDDTDMLFGSEISIYQMLVGCAQWAVILGRFDIQFTTNTMA